VAVIDAREPEPAEGNRPAVAEILRPTTTISYVRPYVSPFPEKEGRLFLETPSLIAGDRMIGRPPFLGELSKDPSARRVVLFAFPCCP